MIVPGVAAAGDHFGEKKKKKKVGERRERAGD